MSKLPDINLLTGKQIEDVLKTCDSYLGKKLGLEGSVENLKLPVIISSLNLTWKSVDDFEKDINLLTKENNIRSSYTTLYKVWEQKLAQEKSEKVEKTTLTPEEAEKLEAEAEKRSAVAKESIEKAQTKQEKWLKLQKDKVLKQVSKEEQQKVLEELKGKVVYATPQKPEPDILLTKEEQSFTDLAKQNPRVFEQKLSEDIIKKNPEIFSSEGLKPLADVIAADTTSVFIDPSQKQIPTGVFTALTKYDKSPEVQKTGVIYTVLSEERQNLYREILNRTIGVNLANRVLGDPETTYEFSEIPPEKPEGSFSLKLDDLQTNSFRLQEGSLNEVFNNPSFGEAKSFVSPQLKETAFSKIASLPKTGLLGKLSQFTTSRSFDSIAPFLGLPTQMSYTGTTFFGKMITTFLPEYAPLITNFTARLGIDIGIKALAPVTGKSIETGIASLAAKSAAGKAVGGVISKFLTVLGGLTSWATFGLSLIGGWLLGKIIEKIPWKKVLPWIVGIPVFVMVSPVAGVAAGLGTFWLLSGLPLKAASFQIGSFFARIGASMAITIGTPIVVAIIVFPILVAIILFIINSGAYIVPPKSSSVGVENPYIRVEKVADPKGPFENSSLPFRVEYTITITAKKSPLTNVQLEYKCEVLRKGVKPGCPNIEGSIPTADEIGTIMPTNPYQFKYSATYSGDSFNDSFVSDTITATADTTEKNGVSTSGSASIIIGKPDIGCYKLITSGEYSIPSQYVSMFNSGMFKIVRDWPMFVAKTCPAAGGDVYIGYGGDNPYYWGWHLHQGTVDFILYEAPLSSLVRTEFVMIHELGHHIQSVNSDYYQQFLDYPGIKWPICTYKATSDPVEAFPETLGLYGSGRVLNDSLGCGGVSGTFKDNYPTNWEFADKIIFH